LISPHIKWIFHLHQFCEDIDRGSILNEAALTLGIPKQTAQRIYKRYLGFEGFAESH
jgi:hypothetical protein